MVNILLVEDDRDISTLIKMNLEYSAYSIEQAFDGNEGLLMLKTREFDLVILDLMLPKTSGFILIPEINKREIPVLILSAKDSLSDRVRGLNSGADDYLVKPFESLELIARVKALLRRRKPKEELFLFGNITVNIQKQIVIKEEVEIDLALKEYKLLEIMVLNPGIIFSRDTLLERIWGYEHDCDTRTVDMHITRLRKKIGFHLIKTVYKRGYKVEV